MATQADWMRRNEGQDQNDPPARNIFPTNDRDESTHHAHDDASTFGELGHVVGHMLEPGYVRTIGLAGLAAGIGLGVGYWLGGRRAAKRSKATRARLEVPDAVKLAPVAAQLLANPTVRIYLARLIWRQIRKQLDSKLDR